MSLILKYVPDLGICLNEKELRWGDKRETVRTLFQYSHSVVALDPRRDVYKRYLEQENFFFLNYDRKDHLAEVEVHHGLSISVADICFSFPDDIADIISRLERIAGAPTQTGYQKFFFRELKLVIATAEAMGGDGNQLGYFYCSSNVKHLTE